MQLHRLALTSLALSMLTVAPGCKQRASESDSGGFLTAVADAGGLYPKTCTPDQKYCAHFAPTDMPVHAVGDYLKSAKRKIRIATYNMNVPWYVDIIKNRIDNNVEVEFLVDYKLSYGSNQVWNKLVAMSLNKPNVKFYRIPVLRGRNPQMHNKIIFVDDEVVLFGSANWTMSGLIGNYENVLAVRGVKPILQQFNAELDELREHSKLACETFVSDPKKCGTGQEAKLWDAGFHTLATTGKFAEGTIKTDETCKSLTFAFLNTVNQPQVSFNQLTGCFTDASVGAKYTALAQKIQNNERYVDGSLTKDDPPRWSPRYTHTSKQTGPVKIFFSPEDNVEWAILKELRDTMKDPETAKRSFAYVSTNFITNKAIAEDLAKMLAAGVRIRVFFDRGRLEDKNFQQALSILAPFKFLEGGGAGVVFDNQLSGPYGCNHNKMAVIYTPQGGLKLLNGSANWSLGAMASNDENLFVIEDERIAAIYLREILSQQFVYKHGSNEQNNDWKGELKALTEDPQNLYTKFNKACFKALLQPGQSCNTFSVNDQGVSNNDNVTWQPKLGARIAMSVTKVPGNPDVDAIWAWIKQDGHGPNGGFGVPVYTDDTFASKWVTSLPVYAGQDVEFKFLKTNKEFDPNKQPFSAAGWTDWEPIGDFVNRKAKATSLSIHRVSNANYTWGLQ